MKSSRIVTSAFVAAMGFMAGMPARADLDISQNPLFLIAPVKPALIMGVDDSGSMDSEIIAPTNDGALWWHTGDRRFTGRGVTANGQNDTTEPGRLNFNAAGGANGTWKKYIYLFPNGSDGSNGFRRRYNDAANDHYAVPPIPAFAYARSPAFNAIYFDPAEEYPPFPSAGSDTFTNANPSSAFFDEARGNGTMDLTQPVRSNNDNWVFRMYQGMTLPTGAIVREANSSPCQPIEGDPFDDNWTELTSDTPITENQCAVAIEYYPATFWLPAGETPPASFGFNGTPIAGGKTPDGQPMFGYEIKPGNFSSPGAYSDAIQSFANWFSYYRKRSLLTRAAIGRSFDEVSFLRTGYFRINNRTNVTMRDLGVATERQAFFDWQYDLRGNGGTPNRESVRHMGQQFDTRDGANAPILEACQRNFGMLVTDGFANAWTGAGVGNTDGPGSPLAGTFLSDGQSNTMADIAYRYYNTHLRSGEINGGKVPVPTACSQANPPLDLDCVEDPHMNLFAVALGAKGLVFGVDEDATNDPYANPPTWPTGFQDRNPTAIDDLWHATLNTRGEMFSATRPQELVEALTGVLREIASRIQPVGISATSTRLDQDSLYFEAELDSTTWSGDLRARAAADDSLEWAATSAMSSGLRSNIYTSVNGNGTAFPTGPASAVANRIFDAGVPNGIRSQIMDYIAGDRGDEEQFGGTLRDRAGDSVDTPVLGDIANSRPKFLGPRNEGWARLPGPAGSSYAQYIDDDKTKDIFQTVLVGANDGMLHAFDAGDGSDRFAYIPAAVHSKLAQLAEPDYEHKFYVDGQVTTGDAYFDNKWKTVAVGGLGAGGKGVYALDVSDPSGFNAGHVLWELDGDVHPELGHVFGEPIITRLGGEWVVIFGNGYNSTSDQPYLFVVQLSNGNVLQKIDMGNTGDNGLAGAAAFLDPATRLFTRRVYAGDLEGKMWRIDFDDSGTGSVAFGGSPLITVTDGRPITSGPTLAANPNGGLMVYFGSGKLIEPGDRIGAPDGTERFWAVRDQESPVSPASLGTATMTQSGGQRVVNGDSGGSANGWSLPLAIGAATGERVLSRPVVSFGQLVFTTFEPDDDPCSPGGARRVYVLNALSGDGQLNQLCPNCGAIEVGLGAPIDPAIVLRPPTPPDGMGDGDGLDPFNPGGGSMPPDAGTVGSTDGWCSELLVLVAGEGFIQVGRVCDGRQVWRQPR